MPYPTNTSSRRKRGQTDGQMGEWTGCQRLCWATSVGKYMACCILEMRQTDKQLDIELPEASQIIH